MAQRGGHRPGAGRKPKEFQTDLIEKLKPLDKIAFKALKVGLVMGDAAYVKMFFAYRFGMPIQTVNNNHSGEMTVNWKEEKTYANAFPLSEINN